MITAMVLGLGIGLALSVPVGPVNIAMISTVITSDEKRAITLGAGGALMDGIFMFIGLTGVSFVHFDQRTTDIFTVIGLLILFALGLKELIFTSKSFDMVSGHPERKRMYFFKGIMFYLTNPTLLPTFIGIAGWIHSQKYLPDVFLYSLITSAFVAMGSLSWFTVFTLVIHKYKKNFSFRVLIIINKITGASLVLFAAYVGYSYFF